MAAKKKQSRRKKPKLKSLAEIAFDAFQCFAPQAAKWGSVEERWDRHADVFKRSKWSDLSQEQRVVWECIAARVSAEIALRRDEDEQ